MDSDRVLIEKIIRGDTAAFRDLIEQFEKLVCQIVFRMISNEADREEVCQEVFLKVYRNLSKFEYQSKLSTWIARIAYHTAINYLKRKRVLLYDDLPERQTGRADREDAEYTGITSVAVEQEPGEQRLMRQELEELLHKEIEALPVLYRTAITLYHLQEMSLKEIAEITDLPLGTIKSYLYRARKHLKQQLLAKYPLEELW